MNIDDAAWRETYSLIDVDVYVNITFHTHHTVIMSTRDIVCETTRLATYWICLDALDQFIK